MPTKRANIPAPGARLPMATAAKVPIVCRRAGAWRTDSTESTARYVQVTSDHGRRHHRSHGVSAPVPRKSTNSAERNETAQYAGWARPRPISGTMPTPNVYRWIAKVFRLRFLCTTTTLGSKRIRWPDKHRRAAKVGVFRGEERLAHPVDGEIVLASHDQVAGGDLGHVAGGSAALAPIAPVAADQRTVVGHAYAPFSPWLTGRADVGAAGGAEAGVVSQERRSGLKPADLWVRVAVDERNVRLGGLLNADVALGPDGDRTGQDHVGHALDPFAAIVIVN